MSLPERRGLERRRDERERSRLIDQLISAEQDERRRLADFLHDTSLQSLSGIALMLDGGLNALEQGRLDEARRVIEVARDRQRKEIAALRDLSFDLEPVVLRDQGFEPAVRELTSRLGLEREVQFDLSLGDAESLAEKAKVALYQMLRESVEVAIRRGPPTRIWIDVGSTEDGGIRMTIRDNARGERRQRTFEALAERARSLNGALTVEAADDGGTTVAVTLPPYVARG